MKTITDIIKEEAINEEKFGYTWENAFVITFVTLYQEVGEKKCKEILKQWFNDQEASSPLFYFLERIGAKPKSRSVDDLMDALVNVSVTKNFTIGQIHKLD